MFWPGMGDPTKRRKTLVFLAITAGIGIAVGVGSSLVLSQLSVNDPLKVCINDRIVDVVAPYTVSASLEIYVDGSRAEIPANVGFEEGGCQRSLYTLSGDGTIYATWVDEYPFEIGHFLWVWEFPLRDMVESESRILVDGAESSRFINTPLEDGKTYVAEFRSKAYDVSEEYDFMPPER